MSAQSVLLFMKLVSEGVGVAKEISELARRIRAGEEITEAEIDLARKQVDESVANWDEAAKEKTEPAEQPEP